MQEAARLPWLIHGNDYDNNIRLKYTNMRNHYISKNLAGSDVP